MDPLAGHAAADDATPRSRGRGRRAWQRQVVFVSATPGPYELRKTGGAFVEQVIRPTGPGRPPDRPAPGARAGGRPAGRDPARARPARARARDDAHQAHGRGPHAVLPGTRRARALPALGHRHARAGRDPARPAAGRLRRAGRHQPAARGPRPAGGVARGRARRRQGGLPAFDRRADPDHRPRGAQRQRPGDPLRRHA